MKELFKEDSWVQKTLLLKIRNKDEIIRLLKEQIKELEDFEND
jgi:hypothetical protein